jgi:hypothetical protein
VVRANKSRYAGRLFAPTYARVVIDGERFTGLVRLAVNAGPRIRIAQPRYSLNPL